MRLRSKGDLIHSPQPPRSTLNSVGISLCPPSPFSPFHRFLKRRGCGTRNQGESTEGDATRRAELQAVEGRSASLRTECVCPLLQPGVPVGCVRVPYPRGPLSCLQLCSARQSAPPSAWIFLAKESQLLWRVITIPSAPVKLARQASSGFSRGQEGAEAKGGRLCKGPLLHPGQRSSSPPPERWLAPKLPGRAVGGGGVCNVQLGPLSVILAPAESSAELSGLWCCSFLACTSA